MKKITTVAPFIFLLGLSSSSFALTSTKPDLFTVTTTSMSQTNFAIAGDITTDNHTNAHILKPNASMLSLSTSRNTKTGRFAIAQIKYVDQTNPANYCNLVITDSVRENDSGWWFHSSTKLMPNVQAVCYGNLSYSNIQTNDEYMSSYDASYTITFNNNSLLTDRNDSPKDNNNESTPDANSTPADEGTPF